MTMTHEYFGKLNLNSHDIWGKEIPLNDKPVAVYLSIDSDNVPNTNLLTPDVLDKCATICQQLEQFDQENRDFLVTYLTKGSLDNHSQFVTDYLDKQADFAESEPLSQFYQGDKSVASFVALLQAMQVNLIIKDSKSLVVTDYMIDPNTSDKVLCVYRKMGGELMDIAIER